MIPPNIWLIPLVALVVPASAYLLHRLFGKSAAVGSLRLGWRLHALIYAYGLLLALFLPALVIHQVSLSGLFGMLPEWADTSSALWTDLDALDERWALYTRHRHFGHGIMHGLIAALLIVAPAVAGNSLLTGRSWRETLRLVLFWAWCMALMGGLLAQFLELPL